MGLPLDVFGQFVMEHLRDMAFEDADLCLKGHWKAPSLQRLQQRLGELSPEQQDLARQFVRHVVDSAVHDFLFAPQEVNDDDKSVQILVHGASVADQSDGLQGELFGSEGWRNRYSKYGDSSD